MVENPASRTPPGVLGSLYTDSAALGRTQKYILWAQRKARVRDRRKWGSENGCCSSVGPRGAEVGAGRNSREVAGGGGGRRVHRVWARVGGGGPIWARVPVSGVQRC